jgi:thioredoxin reductase (NADPH)
MRLLGWIIGSAAILFTAFMLAPRRNYQPGLLLAAHRQLDRQCAACHRAWHGPVSQRCVICHGDINDVNPHGSMDMSDELTAAPAGHRLILDQNNYLLCMSCHAEHQGRAVNVNVTAAFSCTWCHQHPSIQTVPEHSQPLMRPAPPVNNFVEPFNHKLHKALIESHYPPRPEGFACLSCHIVNPVIPRPTNSGIERVSAVMAAMAFRWSSCAGAGCHIAPQDGYLKLPASMGTNPSELPYRARVFHINAEFEHSPGHLASECITCHTSIPDSTSPDDDASLTVAQCFTCHDHQSPPQSPHRASVAMFSDNPGHARAELTETRPQLVTPVQATVTWLSDGVAHAADVTAPPMDGNRVVECGQCHLFHYHGVVLANDFRKSAPRLSPDLPPPLSVRLRLPVLSSSGWSIRLVRLSPWWIGTLGVFAASLGFLVLPRLVPSKASAGEVMIEVAPQPAHEVPLIDDTFQTSVRHLYLVGEAAGTASINLAMRSGRQVIEAIEAELKRQRPPVPSDVYDVAIIGCGPAGLGATATAQIMGLNYLTLEKMTPASTLRSYPRAKFVQATPIDIAEYGTFFLEGDNSREDLIREWERIIAKLNLKINDRQEVVDIQREPAYFRLHTARGNLFRARCVVLAIGVRGNPRHLNIPGDEPSRVHYNLIDADEYRNRQILVLGGGNAGAEITQALSDSRLGNRVSYSFRTAVLANVTRENADKISELQRAQRITLYPASVLTAIKPGKVVLSPFNEPAAAHPSNAILKQPIELDNELIFALIGAELPAAFLRKIGIRMGSKGRFTLTPL